MAIAKRLGLHHEIVPAGQVHLGDNVASAGIASQEDGPDVSICKIPMPGRRRSRGLEKKRRTLLRERQEQE